MANNKQPEIVQVRDIIIIRREVKSVLIKKHGQQYWIPMSQVHGPVKDSDTCINITPWAAKEKGLY